MIIDKLLAASARPPHSCFASPAVLASWLRHPDEDPQERKKPFAGLPLLASSLPPFLSELSIARVLPAMACLEACSWHRRAPFLPPVPFAVHGPVAAQRGMNS